MAYGYVFKIDNYDSLYMIYINELSAGSREIKVMQNGEVVTYNGNNGLSNGWYFTAVENGEYKIYKRNSSGATLIATSDLDYFVVTKGLEVFYNSTTINNVTYYNVFRNDVVEPFKWEWGNANDNFDKASFSEYSNVFKSGLFRFKITPSSDYTAKTRFLSLPYLSSAGRTHIGISKGIVCDTDDNIIETKINSCYVDIETDVYKVKGEYCDVGIFYVEFDISSKYDYFYYRGCIDVASDIRESYNNGCYILDEEYTYQQVDEVDFSKATYDDFDIYRPIPCSINNFNVGIIDFIDDNDNNWFLKFPNNDGVIIDYLHKVKVTGIKEIYAISSTRKFYIDSNNQVVELFNEDYVMANENALIRNAYYLNGELNTIESNPVTFYNYKFKWNYNEVDRNGYSNIQKFDITRYYTYQDLIDDETYYYYDADEIQFVVDVGYCFKVMQLLGNDDRVYIEDIINETPNNEIYTTIGNNNKNASIYLVTPTNDKEYIVNVKSIRRTGIKLQLYSITDVRRKLVNKTLSNPTILYGNFTENTSILKPSVTIESNELPLWNYAYLEDLKRYYFVGDVISIGENLWELPLEEDVLKTYEHLIINHSHFCYRGGTLNTTNIIPSVKDSSLRKSDNETILTKEMSFLTGKGNGGYVIIAFKCWAQTITNTETIIGTYGTGKGNYSGLDNSGFSMGTNPVANPSIVCTTIKGYFELRKQLDAGLSPFNLNGAKITSEDVIAYVKYIPYELQNGKHLIFYDAGTRGSNSWTWGAQSGNPVEVDISSELGGDLYKGMKVAGSNRLVLSTLNGLGDINDSDDRKYMYEVVIPDVIVDGEHTGEYFFNFGSNSYNGSYTSGYLFRYKESVSKNMFNISKTDKYYQELLDSTFIITTPFSKQIELSFNDVVELYNGSYQSRDLFFHLSIDLSGYSELIISRVDTKTIGGVTTYTPVIISTTQMDIISDFPFNTDNDYQNKILQQNNMAKAIFGVAGNMTSMAMGGAYGKASGVIGLGTTLYDYTQTELTMRTTCQMTGGVSNTNYYRPLKLVFIRKYNEVIDDYNLVGVRLDKKNFYIKDYISSSYDEQFYSIEMKDEENNHLGDTIRYTTTEMSVLIETCRDGIFVKGGNN